MNMKISEMMDLAGRVALVTGGAGHIGIACCEALAEQGAAVVVLDCDANRCNQLSERLARDYAAKTMPLIIDLKDEVQLCGVPQICVERFGRLDILVNCAAIVGTSELKGWVVPFPVQATDTWRMALETNLTAAFVLSRECAGLLAVGGHGSIVNFASIHGMVGPDMSLYEGTSMGNPAAYAASKGGLLQLTRWLATVLAPDIRVNAISPGGVLRGQPECFQQRYIARVPLRRMAIEADFKGAIAYLASDLSAYVTGQNLVVDGGWTAW
jgi:NAD(P)-dependent dehydrogenase (short-subunit alcohol dehydrogenase family)